MDSQGDLNDRGSVQHSSPMPYMQRHPGLLSSAAHRSYPDAAMVEQQQQQQQILQQQASGMSHSYSPHRQPTPYAVQYVSSHSSNYSAPRQPYRPQTYRPPEPANVQESQHLKKFRTHQPKPEHQQPLEIIIKEPSSGYAPQVEAISPTPIAEDVRSTREELLSKINKVDRDIAQVTQRLAQLKKKETTLQEIGYQLPEEAEMVTPRPTHHSLAQKIYAENRKKSKEAHAVLDALGPPIKVPLYNQPSDSPVYHDNQRCFSVFKPRLEAHLRKKAIERHNYRQKITKTYGELMTKWLKQVEKHENSLKKTQAKSREIFEKIFPDIRKHREERERYTRAGNRLKSDADLEEIMDGIKEQEMEDKKIRSMAVVPPMLLDPDSRRHKFINRNGRIYELGPEHKEWTNFNIWTSEEKELFKEKYLQHPKQFGTIASYFEKKKISDCVQHYYLTKKQENYKLLVPKTRQGRARPSRNNPGGVRCATSTSSDLSSGVTTRLQREHMQRQQESGPRATASANTSISETPAVSTLPPEPAEERPPSATPTAEDVPVSEPLSMETETSVPEPQVAIGAIQPLEQNMDVDPSNERVANSRRNVNDDVESSDEESGGLQISGPHMCAVCNTSVDSPAYSRHLPRNHAKQYGLAEEDVLPGSRVCNTCRCKSVRSRCMVCPLPNCPNAKGIVKRLRSIPSKWTNLPPDKLDPVCHIPSGATKCCSACYTRISRRLAPFLSPETSVLRWTEAEVEAVRTALKLHGAQWVKVAECVRGRSQQECKTFFMKCRKKYNLDAAVREFSLNNFGEDRKPVLTDEEESGSSTSSCEEQPADAADSSDTASAGSPPKQSDSTTPSGKETTCSVTISRQPFEGSRALDGLTAHIPSSSGGSLNGALPMSPPSAVNDLMAHVIEKQLMKSPSGLTIACSAPPTITSILNTDTNFKRAPGESLATLTLTSVPDRGQSSSAKAPELPKVPVVVQSHHVVREREAEPETLDLSIKGRNTPDRPPTTSSNAYYAYSSQPVHSKGGVIIYREQPYFHPTSKPQSMMTPHLVMSTSRSSHNLPPSAGMPRLSPSVPPPGSSSKTGSITHGTPVQAGTRYDPIRQIPQHREGGSITQGTPVHHLLPQAEKRQSLDMKRSSPSVSNAAYGSPYPPSHLSTSYPLERQLSSRQIILNDYITSQQMHRGSGPVADKRDSRAMPHLPYSAAQNPMYLHRTETTSSSPMRHSTLLAPQEQNRSPSSVRSGKYYPPPGHEAFSSLVEAAVKQPSLPVPPNDKKHFSPREAYQEGLGKTMSDSFSSPRTLEHQRTATSLASDHQQIMRRNQERERELIMSQRSQEQGFQRDSSRQQYQFHMQRQLQVQMEQQRMEQNHIARMEHARAEQHRIEAAQATHAKQLQQRQPQPMAQYMDSQRSVNVRDKEREQREREREWERERDRERERERGSGRIVMASGYQRERQQSPLPVAVSPPPSGSQRKDNHAATSLIDAIDAIITHQINQTSDSSGPGPHTAGPSQPRPGDRLFSDFLGPRHIVEPNGKRSPMKRTGSPLEREPVKNISLSEHIDSVIAKDYNLGAYPHNLHRSMDSMSEQGHRPSSSHSEMVSERNKMEERQIIQLTQMQGGGNSGKPGSTRFHSEKPAHLMDYMKSRIVEVMRTSDSKDRDEGVGEADDISSVEQRQPTPQDSSSNPPPLSAMYEPLSDNED